MEREIKFRGKRVDNGEWVYGVPGYDFSQQIKYIMPDMFFATRDYGELDDEENVIIEDTVALGGFYAVIPETVGQLIGLKDKNGVEIFANSSIVKFKLLEELNKEIELTGTFNYCVEELRHELDIFNNEKYLCLSYLSNGTMYDFEVIGNIHDSPELLGS